MTFQAKHKVILSQPLTSSDLRKHEKCMLPAHLFAVSLSQVLEVTPGELFLATPKVAMVEAESWQNAATHRVSPEYTLIILHRSY
jgi:hypothetical protein